MGEIDSIFARYEPQPGDSREERQFKRDYRIQLTRETEANPSWWYREDNDKDLDDERE
jgi:hypothetical protein